MTGRSKGFTLLELLIVVAIVGVVLGIGFINGRQTLRTQQERAAINTIQQSFWQGATSSAATGRPTRLMRDRRDLTIVDDADRVLRRFELPQDTETTLPDGEVLAFTPPGKIAQASLTRLRERGALTVEANDKTYELTISLIGEVKAEVRQ